MEETKWICDREQCRYISEEQLPPPSKIQAIFTLLGGLIILLFGFWTIIGFFVGLGLMAFGIKLFSWRQCPACRRGAMLSSTHPRGAALLRRAGS
jgi:hypothetical protein